jgi:Zn-dependent protease
MDYSQYWLLEMTLWIIPTAMAVSFRESAKAWTCNLLGDANPKRAGKVSLNPFKNLDPIGTLIVPFLLILRHQPIIAWAKKVEIHSSYLKYRHFGTACVIFAGLASNLAMASGWHLILYYSQFLNDYPFIELLINHMAKDGIYINAALIIMHLIPIAPMDISYMISSVLPRFPKSIYQLTNEVGHYFIAIIIFLGFYEDTIKSLISIAADLSKALVI